MRKSLLAACVLGALAFVGAAAAHVSVHPNALPSGGFTAISVQVPNELPNASTTEVEVKFPSGFYFLSWIPIPGSWKAKVYFRKLDKPVKVFDDTSTQEVDRVVFSGGKIGPGQLVSFALSVLIPSKPKGTVLTFKAIQTYSNGKVVRWIGGPSAEEPAPQVLVVGADEPVQDFPAGLDAAKKRKTASHLVGFALGAPLIGLLGLGLVGSRRRRRAS